MINTCKKNNQIGLENPWTKNVAKYMSWTEIKKWANENIHSIDIRDWLSGAMRAYHKNDSGMLGHMIIGS
ncbi:unnamed protein product [marine sediment metagenome]|uniref:Uncharacterized protein n=1 Tax=marine sediment metagenome TaxID=412755 RepID=X0T202_9ZZZZ